jgi:hypothetical protein
MIREELMEKNYPHPHQAILDRCFIDINQVTIPLYKPRDGGIRPWGTGTLLHVGDRHFILTAAHVIDDITHVRAPFYLPPRESEGEPYPLTPADLVNSPLPAGVADRNDDPVDLALVELRREAVDHVSVRRRFASLADFGRSTDESPGFYLLSGYPLDNEGYIERQRLSITETRHYVTELHDEMNDQDRERKFQILLKYPRDLLITSRGVEPRYPHPNGLSGCGVWKMIPKRPGEWTVGDRKLVAVQHTYVNSSQQLRATRIEAVVQLLIHSFPDTIPALKDLKGDPS